MSSFDTSPRVQARLGGYADLTSRVVGLRVEAPKGFVWVPGQHVALGGDEQGRGASYYSIASAPRADAPGVFEIAASHESLPFGFELSEGTRFWLSPAQGGLPFERIRGALRVVLIGMGTGVSPLRAVAQALLQGAGPEVILIQGARSERECLFHQEFLQLSGERFGYRPVLSRADENWAGLRGRVQAHLNEAEGDEYCVCGSAEMAQQVKSLLTERGVAAAQIFSEGY